MFSIEKILEEIITFIKKIFFTFYKSLFMLSMALQENKLGAGNVIKPGLYLLIGILLFLAFMQMNLFFITDSFDKILLNYFHFLEQPVNSSVKYTIPIGAAIYVAVYAIGRIFFSAANFNDFKNLVFYTLGTSLMLYVIFHFTIIAILSFPFDFHFIATHQIAFNRMIYCIDKSVFVFCFFYPLLNLMPHVKKNFAFILVPVLNPFLILCCVCFMEIFIPYTDLNRKQQINFVNLHGTQNFKVSLNCISDCSLSALKSELVIQNKGKSALFLHKNDDIFFKAYQDDANIEIGNKYQFSLSIQKMDNDSLAELKILRPGDYLRLSCNGTAEKDELKKLLAHTKKK